MPINSITNIYKLKIKSLWLLYITFITAILISCVFYFNSLYDQSLLSKSEQNRAINGLLKEILENKVEYIDQKLYTYYSLISKHQSILTPQTNYDNASSFNTEIIKTIFFIGPNSQLKSIFSYAELPDNTEEFTRIAKASLIDKPFTIFIQKTRSLQMARVLPIHSESGEYVGTLVAAIDTNWIEQIISSINKSYDDQIILRLTDTNQILNNELPIIYQASPDLQTIEKSIKLKLIIQNNINLGEFNRKWISSKKILTIYLSIFLILTLIPVILIHYYIRIVASRTTIAQHLKEELDLRSKFFANMAHEIRTPLSGVLGACELLLDSNPSLRQKNILDIMSISGNQLLAIMNEMLDISKIQAHKIQLSYSYTHLISTLEGSILTFQPLARTKSLNLYSILNIPFDITAYIDALRLAQVLTNLLSNAIKFTNKGYITVTANIVSKTHQFKLIKVLSIKIQDTGSGIEPHYLNKIFIPFFQIVNNDYFVKPSSGSGLGLTISKELINLMGGDLYFDSIVGVGTTVTLEVPLKIKSINIHSSDDIAHHSKFILENQLLSYRNISKTLSSKFHILLDIDDIYLKSSIEAQLKSFGITGHNFKPGELNKNLTYIIFSNKLNNELTIKSQIISYESQLNCRFIYILNNNINDSAFNEFDKSISYFLNEPIKYIDMLNILEIIIES